MTLKFCKAYECNIFIINSHVFFLFLLQAALCNVLYSDYNFGTDTTALLFLQIYHLFTYYYYYYHYWLLTYVLVVVIAVIFSARRVITNDQRLKTAAMELFCKNGQRLLALNYVVKKGFVVDVRVGSEYATEMSFSWFYLMVSCYNLLLVIPCCEQDTIIFLLLQKRLSIKL